MPGMKPGMTGGGSGAWQLSVSWLYSYQPFPPRGAFMRRHWCGERSGACCRASQRGTGTARGPASGYYEPARGARWRRGRARCMSSRKARPGPRNRRAGALRSAPLAREATNGRPDAPSALRPPRFLRGL